MKYFVLLTLVCSVVVKAGILPNGGTTTNIQGPSSQSRIVGPDGAVIIAQSPGGQIVHEETPAVFGPAGHFLGPQSPFINPDVPGMAAHKAVDTIVAGPQFAAAARQYAAHTVSDGTHSIMGDLETPPGGSTAGIGIEIQ